MSPQLDLFVGKWARLRAQKGKDSDVGPFPDQRNAETAAYVYDAGVILNSSPIEVGIGQKIRNMNCVALEYRATEHRSPIRLGRVATEVVALLGSEAEGRGDRIYVALPSADNPRIRFAYPGRRLDQRVEHRLQVKC